MTDEFIENEKIVEENIYNTDSKFSCKRILLKFFNITYVTMKAIFNILKKSFIWLYRNIPSILLGVLALYVFLQTIAFLLNNLLPNFIDNFKGCSIFFEKYFPFAFHSTTLAMGIGKVAIYFATAIIYAKGKLYIDASKDFYGNPSFGSYLFAIFLGFYIWALVSVEGFKFLGVICWLIAWGALSGKTPISDLQANTYCSNNSTMPVKSSSQNIEIAKTYKFEQVRQLANQVSAVRRVYENGKKTGTGTTWSKVGKLISASADQIIIEYGNHWQTYDAQTGSQISAVPKPR